MIELVLDRPLLLSDRIQVEHLVEYTASNSVFENVRLAEGAADFGSSVIGRVFGEAVPPAIDCGIEIGVVEVDVLGSISDHRALTISRLSSSFKKR